MREHVASDLTDRELEHARRELSASLALSRPGSPVRAPIQAQLSAIDAELAERTQDASAVGLCSCGFATDDQQWLACHLIDHPGHRGTDLY
jgi:hypothetical protein